MNFDKLIARLVALGIPALVLILVVATTGLAGGAAIVAALAILGGPFGMWGGIALLGLLVLISQALAEYGFERVFVAVLKGLRQKGHTKKQILQAIDSYPISIALKLKLRAYVEQFWSDDGPDADGSAAHTRPPAPEGGAAGAKDIPT
jgi:uncharacterized membrane protein